MRLPRLPAHIRVALVGAALLPLVLTACAAPRTAATASAAPPASTPTAAPPVTSTPEPTPTPTPTPSATAPDATTTAEPSSTAVRAADYLTYSEDPQGYRSYEFVSPTGNLRCSINRFESGVGWGCSAGARTWAPPVLPLSYERTDCGERERAFGSVYFAAASGRFTAVCEGEIPERPDVTTLAAGRRLTALEVTCALTGTAIDETVRCSSEDGATLTMSVDRLDLTD